MNSVVTSILFIPFFVCLTLVSVDDFDYNQDNEEHQDEDEHIQDGEDEDENIQDSEDEDENIQDGEDENIQHDEDENFQDYENNDDVLDDAGMYICLYIPRSRSIFAYSSYS